MKKETKVEVVKEFVGIFSEPGVYLLDFKGLNVAQITELRSLLRDSKVSMRVVKNTLAKRALQEAGVKNLDEYFAGPTGVIWSEDSVTPAKILIDFLKKYNKGTLKAGLIEGSVFGDKDIDKFPNFRAKLELYAKVASVLNAPMVKLARTLKRCSDRFCSHS